MKQGRAARKAALLFSTAINRVDSMLLPDHLHSHPIARQFSCYWTEQNCASTAVDLIHFGYGQFRRARKIARIDMLERLNQHGDRPEYHKEILEFCQEGVVDAVRICICFENYMKARLLAEGFLIHELDRGVAEVRELAKAQRNRPVSLNEVVEMTGGWHICSEGLGYLHGVKRQTLKMSCMLGQTYQEHIRLPERVLEFVTELNDDRNNLHFYHQDGFSTSNEALNSLRELIRFVKGPMTIMHDSIIGNYNLPERFLIHEAPPTTCTEAAL